MEWALFRAGDTPTTAKRILFRSGLETRHGEEFRARGTHAAAMKLLTRPEVSQVQWFSGFTKTSGQGRPCPYNSLSHITRPEFCGRDTQMEKRAVVSKRTFERCT
ncbi:hypothetical protein KKG05_01645 [bacterium]|nr:hypothetical protein [bacterium]